MIIDPKDADPVRYGRERVIVLSDWSFFHPHRMAAPRFCHSTRTGCPILLHA